MNAQKPIHVEGEFPVHFRYTAGVAGERLLREIKDNGRLVASRCPNCNLNYLPPRIYCERCMSKLDEYVQIENNGAVETFTQCYQDADGKPLSEPVTVALVRFPSAHGGIVHKAKGPVSIGDKVRLVFREKSERTGSILDIEYFEKRA
jgi:uncharacterized OB-fold protein